MGGGKGRWVDPFWHVSIYWNLKALNKKKCSNYSDCEMWICFQVECCVWEQFSFKASGSHPPCVVEQVKSPPLFANNLENSSYQMTATTWSTLNQSWSEIKRKIIADDVGKRTHRTMPSFTFLPSSSSQQIERLVDCDSISEFQHSSSQEPCNFAILGTDLRPTWSLCKVPHGAQWSTTMHPNGGHNCQGGICDSFNY